MAVRIAVHRGQVYRVADDSVYGLAVNVAARLQNFAAPNEVVISDEVQRMVGRLSSRPKPSEPKSSRAWTSRCGSTGSSGNGSTGRCGRPDSTDRSGTEEWDRLLAAWTRGPGDETEVAVPLLLRGEAGSGKVLSGIGVGRVGRRRRAPWSSSWSGLPSIDDPGLHPVRRLLETNGWRPPRHRGCRTRLRLLPADLVRRGLPPDTICRCWPRPRPRTCVGLRRRTGGCPQAQRGHPQAAC